MSGPSTAATGEPGGPVGTEDLILETGASLLQTFPPVKSICAHLNAFHAYADDPGRFIETNHYCAHVSSSVRQCLLYDSHSSNARLIGVEYMITPDLYAQLEPEERKLWHSHVYEVKSGMLVMPEILADSGVPVVQQTWETAETKEMGKVIELYGKVYHLWQTDRGDELPLGPPQLMTSFTEDGQMDFEKVVGDRDARYGTSWKRKKELRKDIKEPTIHPDADYAWKRRASF